MKTGKVVLAVALACLLAGQVFANERAYMAFDQEQQKMHLIFESDVPTYGVVTFNHGEAVCGLPQVFNPETGQYEPGYLINGETQHWCEIELDPGNLEVGEQTTIQGKIQLTNEAFAPLQDSVVVEDWNPLTTNDGQTLEYLNGCNTILPPSIPIGFDFCAHICHGTYVIPIICEDPNHTPETLEITVTNRCNPAEGSHCDEPSCANGVDWGLFGYEIRVIPPCFLFLTLSYCGYDEGCVCIYRSDHVLPVEISRFTAVANDGSVRLAWTSGSESNLQEYRISRSTNRDYGYEDIYHVNAENRATGASYSYVDTHVQNGTTYFYKLHVQEMDGSISVYNIDGQSVIAEATPMAGADVPNEFSLAQNYPNPFNSQTTFSFTLPEAGDVTLKVYDLLGREVATVAQAAMSAGQHKLNWTAENLAAGVYMYTLTSGEFSQSKKLVYLK